MRGRKVEAGDSSCILFVRHKKTCKEYGNNADNVDCDCIRNVQFRDGSRQSTSEWKWSRAEDKARQLLSERLGLGDVAQQPAGGNHSVEKAVDQWIEEREKDGLTNVKARHLTAKLVAWCQRNNIRCLEQIQKQALRAWRTAEWKYAHGDSSSMKIHWSVLSAFFDWCVEGDLLESNPCPKLKGKIQEKEVIPFSPKQIDLLIHTAATMPKWDTVQRLKVRGLILLMRWSGMSIGDSVRLERGKLVGQHIQRNRRKKTKKKFSVPIPNG
jgi:integrase/recombinase XerD